MPESTGGGVVDRQIEIKNAAKPWDTESLSARKPPDWGTSLSDNDYRMLEASWMTRDIADAALLRRLSSLEGSEIVGQRGHRDCAGVLITSTVIGREAAGRHNANGCEDATADSAPTCAGWQ